MIVLKTSKELAKMRKACSLSAQALEVGGAAVHPGITTGEIDRIIKSFILSKGAKPSFLGYGGFSGSACISINDEIIHGIPGRRVINEGDIVSIDVGAYYDGYHGDNAATFAAGAISPQAQALMDATKESLEKAIAVIGPGTRVGDIGHAVQSHVEPLGFGVVREYVGHGVGKDLHEEPEVPNFGTPGRGVRLMPGMVIAIEPMITEHSPALHVLDDDWTVVTNDHGLAAHYEHTIAITEKGPVILTLP